MFALCAALGLLTAPAANAQGKVAVADTQPGWASPANLAGTDPNASRVVFSVWLGWNRRGQLDQTLADILDDWRKTKG